MSREPIEALRPALEEAEHKAWDSLGRYKFQMFGYWAGIWVHLNRVGGFNLRDPFGDLVHAARKRHPQEGGRDHYLRRKG